MYAVIMTGGKQYRVAEGDLLKVEKIDAEAGSTVSIDKVLLVSDGDDLKVGTPYVDGAKVDAEVEEHGLGDKIQIIRFKRRKKYRRTLGHRQPYTALRIKSIG